MSGIWRDVKYFWNQKCFAVGISVWMVMSYITLLINPTVGIDDTSFKLYYVDGVAPAMGRWCLYMINKVLPLKFNLHFMDAVGLCVFCISITLWCVVFYRMFQNQLPVAVYTIFGCVMLSSPMISEVVVWILHDGIFLGFGATALAVLLGMEALRTHEGTIRGMSGLTGRERLLLGFNVRFRWLLASAVMLTVALGFYEAFMIVYFMAMVMNFLLIRLLDKPDYKRTPLIWLIDLAVITVCAMILRSFVINSITSIYHLEEQKLVLASRDGSDILQLFFGWFDGSRSVYEFTYVLKDFFVKYYLNAIVYSTVMILVIAVGIVGLFGAGFAVRKKDGWIFAAAVGIILLPWIMPILEGHATYYRASEYIPLLTAFAVLLVAWVLRGRGRVLKGIALTLALYLLYWQGYEMNKWLYIDALKYENDKRVMAEVALKIQENCDSTKPICVIGSYQNPEGLVSDAYTPDWSKKYMLVRWLVNAVDPEIFEKYDTEWGYAAAETPLLSFINWASVAFYGYDIELIKFWEMHGHDFVVDRESSHYVQAREMMRDAPVWPREGSVVELEDYIIVNFGNFD